MEINIDHQTERQLIADNMAMQIVLETT